MEFLTPRFLRAGPLLPSVACAMIALSGCVGLPLHVEKHRTEALENSDSTSLGRIVARSGGTNLSGIRLLTLG